MNFNTISNLLCNNFELKQLYFKFNENFDHENKLCSNFHNLCIVKIKTNKPDCTEARSLRTSQNI